MRMSVGGGGGGARSSMGLLPSINLFRVRNEGSTYDSFSFS